MKRYMLYKIYDENPPMIKVGYSNHILGYDEKLAGYFNTVDELAEIFERENVFSRGKISGNESDLAKCFMKEFIERL